MKLFLPKQHGAWAMLIIPFWLGVAATKMVWQHIPFFVGWLLLYLATYPMLFLFKRKKLSYYLKWTIIYLAPALLLLIVPLWYETRIFYFGICMVPFFIVNAYYSSRNKDRAFGNDICAILAFSIAGMASGFLAFEEITANLILVFSSCILFFVGSTFYVKSMIREKKNKFFKWISWCYHLFVPFVWLLLGEWLVCIAFIPSLIRAIGLYGKPLSAKKVGIYEIVNAVIFYLILVTRLI
ncbi:YwiC-like family protein [Bacillus sp. CGMCC 1.16607]|uniref:YwiC-like family protein n=1 Tax=Bacillus sp. CGMCC 1.16607 TaxID=3351842 RepID=UPI0036404E8A